jgi:hypothetical protein
MATDSALPPAPIHNVYMIWERLADGAMRPFYVGRGRNDWRMDAHWNAARRGRDSPVANRFREVWSEGRWEQHNIVASSLTWAEAADLEARLIRQIGLTRDGRGSLLNLKYESERLPEPICNVQMAARFDAQIRREDWEDAGKPVWRSWGRGLR